MCAKPAQEWRFLWKKNSGKEAVVYQIYPRSFMDSNGDGVGVFAALEPAVLFKLLELT